VTFPDATSPRLLAKLGYETTRQTSSHLRLTTRRNGVHQDHHPIRVGTLAGILSNVAQHHDLTRDELVRLLFSGK
jgi:hypothetical protein